MEIFLEQFLMKSLQDFHKVSLYDYRKNPWRNSWRNSRMNCWRISGISEQSFMRTNAFLNNVLELKFPNNLLWELSESFKGESEFYRRISEDISKQLFYENLWRNSWIHFRNISWINACRNLQKTPGGMLKKVSDGDFWRSFCGIHKEFLQSFMRISEEILRAIPKGVLG